LLPGPGKELSALVATFSAGKMWPPKPEMDICFTIFPSHLISSLAVNIAKLVC
jgi:hypothetical protein